MSYDKHQIARASAVTTNAEVAAATLALDKVHDSRFTVTADVTIGALTHCLITLYASHDGTTWDLIYNESGSLCRADVTGSDTVSLSAPNLAGYLFARATVTGDAGFAGSLVALKYNWLRKGSQI